jgi:hypothetical protein
MQGKILAYKKLEYSKDMEKNYKYNYMHKIMEGKR